MDATQALLLANIKRIRSEKRLTQKDVAEGCGMLVPTYSRLERGGSNPSLASIVRIADALGVAVIELFQSAEIKDKSVAQKLSMVNDLSEYNKNVVEILLDSIIEKDKLEKTQEVKMQKRLKELKEIRES